MQQDEQEQQDPPPARPKRASRRRGPTWLGVLLDSVFSAVVSITLFVGLLLGGAVYVLQGKQIAAPEWVQEEIAVRIAASAPDLIITFDDVAGMIDENWRPRLFLRDLDIRNAADEEIVRFSDVTLGVDLAALLDRRFALRELRAAGVFVTMRRAENGVVSIQTSAEAGSVRREVANLAQFIREVDGVLLQPALLPLSEVDVQAITLRYEDIRAQRAWTIDGGRMSMQRDGSDLTLSTNINILGGSADVATISATYAGVIGEAAADFGFTLANLDARDIASQSPAFSWLSALQAPISGALRGGVDEDGTLRPLNASLQIGPGVIQPTEEALPIPIEGAQSYFTYTPADQRLSFTQFEIDTQWGRGALEGYAEGALGPTGAVTELVGQFQLSGLGANPAGFYETPVEIASAELDFRLRLSPFSLEIGRLQVVDQGSVLSARGRADVDARGWRVAADAEIDQIDVTRVKALWPEHIKEKTRRWIGRNLYKGTLRSATTAFRMSQGEKPQVYLAFEYEGATARFLRQMPLIRNGNGHATLVDDRFVLMVNEGDVRAPQGGEVDVGGSSFIVPDTTAKPDTPAVVRLKATAPVVAGLSLLDQPPLEVMRNTKLPVDFASGDMVIEATLSLPLKRNLPVEEVNFDVSGTLQDVESTVLVPDRTVLAETLVLKANETGVSLSGQGTLDGIPLEVVWEQPIGPPGSTPAGQVTGTIELTSKTLDTFDVTLPRGTVSGRGTAQITLRTPRGADPTLSLTSDLTGLRLSVPQIGWGKSERRDGTLEVDLTLGEVPKVERLTLEAPGLSLSGDVLLTEDRLLERIRLDRLRVSNWLNARLDLVSRGAGRPLGVQVRGGSLDLRNIDLPQRKPQAEGSPLSVALDRVVLTDTVSFTDVRGGFDTSGGLSGNFEGRVNGQAPVSGVVIPQDGRSAIRVSAQDAGAVVRSAGLVQRARGGRMDLVLTPVGQDGAFDGQLNVQDVRITNAPAIAALVNAISVVGLINELNGDGIYFSDLDADFRFSRSQITLRKASAVGASLGLSMDGIFVPETGALQLQGVISPIYALNAVGSVLTRRGEGLFGFNYSITGTTKDPQVFVNPLTALAPGMFRNLFRRAQPVVPLEDGEERPPEPQVGYTRERGSDR